MSTFSLPEGRWARGHLDIVLPPAKIPPHTPSLGRSSEKSPPLMVPHQCPHSPSSPPSPSNLSGSEVRGPGSPGWPSQESFPSSEQQCTGKAGAGMAGLLPPVATLRPIPLQAPPAAHEAAKLLTTLICSRLDCLSKSPFPQEPLTGNSQ